MEKKIPYIYTDEKGNPLYRQIRIQKGKERCPQGDQRWRAGDCRRKAGAGRSGRPEVVRV